MPARLSSPEKEASRKRKAHKKSRAGCQNCKLRRVKCDEGKPCQKCRNYGVACSYGAGAGTETSDDLQSSFTHSFSIAPAQESLVAYQKPMTDCMSISLTTQLPQFPQTPLIRTLKVEDLDLLGRFQDRTALTIGTAGGMMVYRREIVRLASSAPFLLHIVLTLTLMHDRYLLGAKSLRRSTAEAYHWYQGTAQFNNMLRRPVHHTDKDALWATAALLGAIAFAAFDAKTPEEAWPLKPSSPSDLEWLKMSDGKREVMKIADLGRPDSVFHSITIELAQDYAAISGPGIEFGVLPFGFAEVFDIDDYSTAENNPYYTPTSVLSRIVNVQCNHKNILRFLGFIGNVPAKYKRLVEQKDARALLLMAYWFASVCSYAQWWLQRRALLQCQSICIYLQRYHPDEVGIQKLLSYPKLMCGMSTLPVYDFAGNRVNYVDDMAFENDTSPDMVSMATSDFSL